MDRQRAVYIERCTYGSGASNGKPAAAMRRGACCLAHLLFQHEYSANFLYALWKRVRKHNASCMGITQNVSDLLQSHTARTMLANSEFLLMLNQAGTHRLELAKFLISL